jgi:hypothetical protein
MYLTLTSEQTEGAVSVNPSNSEGLTDMRIIMAKNQPKSPPTLAKKIATVPAKQAGHEGIVAALQSLCPTAACRLVEV